MFLQNINYFSMLLGVKVTTSLFSWHSLKLMGKNSRRKKKYVWWHIDYTGRISGIILIWKQRFNVVCNSQKIPFYESSSGKALQMSVVHIKSKKYVTYQIVLNELLAKLKRRWRTVCQVLEFFLELHMFQNFNTKTKKSTQT